MIKIIVDSKEAGQAGKVVSNLKSLGAKLEIKPLDAGDYILSNELAAERKTVTDFVSTLMRRKLFEQVFALKDTYPNAFLIFEGYAPLIHKFSRIKPGAVWAAMFTLARHGIPIIPTLNQRETAQLLYSAARLEQTERKRTPRIHPVKKFRSLREAQIYFISSLPGIGAERARSILERYGTPAEALDNVDSWPDEIDGIGSKTAEKASKILHSTSECG